MTKEDINTMTKEYSYSKYDTLVVFGVSADNMDKLTCMGSEFDFKVYAADSLEDLLAIPCFCIIMNPTVLSREKLSFLYNAWADMGAGAVSALLTDKSPCKIPQAIKDFIFEDPALFNEEGILRFRILARKAVSRLPDYWEDEDEQV